MTKGKTLLQLWLEGPGQSGLELTAAERILLKLDPKHGFADPFERESEDFHARDFETRDSWDKDRIIRSEILKWVITEGLSSGGTQINGLFVYNARIEGSLVLGHTSIPYSLSFRFCVFNMPFFMFSGHCVKLVLTDCHLSALHVPFMHFKNDLEIGGCIFGGVRGAQESGRTILDISTNGSTIEGSLKIDIVRLVNGIDLLGTRIGRELRITGVGQNDLGDSGEADAKDLVLVIQSTNVGTRFFLGDFERISKLKVDLKGSQCGVFVDDRSSWPAKGFLQLDQFTYSTIKAYKEGQLDVKERLVWLRLQASDNLLLQPWNQLASAYKNNGDDDSAKRVLIDKERWLVEHGKLSRWTRFWKIFLGATIGYGYRPERALTYILIIIIASSFMFRLGHTLGTIRPIDRDADIEEIDSNFNSFLFSVDLFFPFLDLNQDRHLKPTSTYHVIVDGVDECFPTDNFVLFESWYVAHICLGWFFSTLLVASLTGLLKKD